MHLEPGVTRARLARSLGMSTGMAADTVRRLTEANLVSEAPVLATGGRGRPTRALGPHPEGPLALVALIAHETWEVTAIALGGEIADRRSAAHSRQRGPTLSAIAEAIDSVWSGHRRRAVALAIGVPGTVSGTTLLQAPNLGWEDVDLAALRPAASTAADLPVVAGNDASLSALAEGRRGAAREAGAFVYLYMDSGVGGALVQDGRLVAGARGLSGEFGHLPLGDPAERCRCGALGCWNTTLDGWALARMLGRDRPQDDVTFTRDVLAAAAADADSAEAGAARVAAASVGRGIAGLVNALDPDLVCLGGIAGEFAELAPDAVAGAYRAGLMSTRAAAPPELRAGALGDLAPRWGAADLAFELAIPGLARGDRG